MQELYTSIMIRFVEFDQQKRKLFGEVSALICRGMVYCLMFVAVLKLSFLTHYLTEAI